MWSKFSTCSIPISIPIWLLFRPRIGPRFSKFCFGPRIPGVRYIYMVNCILCVYQAYDTADIFRLELHSFLFQFKNSSLKLTNICYSNCPLILCNHFFLFQSPKNIIYNSFGKFDWILFPRMTLGDIPICLILFPWFFQWGLIGHGYQIMRLSIWYA